ncbi:MAG: flagellar basal-body rod protein FlgG [Ignavibacteriaceae bacterium]|nr:flagellar basal-body rod protein FlgG [Ignavibacteriaceae bacterium]
MSTRALRTAASGMSAQELNIEVISNNIANINTTAFKKNKPQFQDLMYQQVSVSPINSESSTAVSGNTLQIGNGVQPTSTEKIFNQGDMTQTNNQLDLAISGQGFFQVKKPDGTYAYTRDGSFKVDSEGKIVTSSGYYLDPSVTIDENTLSVTIAKDGSVQATKVGGSTSTAGNIELARFMNPGGLKSLGDNLYEQTEASGTPIIGTPNTSSFGSVNQGYLEASNVDIVEEMISMISAQRAYEINSKTVQTVEQMMQMANNLKNN